MKMPPMEYKHNMLKVIGKIGKDDAAIFTHYLTDGKSFQPVFISIVYGFNERDFKNITEAYLWFIERQRQEKRAKRSRRADYQRRQYWKKHTFSM